MEISKHRSSGKLSIDLYNKPFFITKRNSEILQLNEFFLIYLSNDLRVVALGTSNEELLRWLVGRPATGDGVWGRRLIRTGAEPGKVLAAEHLAVQILLVLEAVEADI